jgi:hypothetical protein
MSITIKTNCTSSNKSLDIFKVFMLIYEHQLSPCLTFIKISIYKFHGGSLYVPRKEVVSEAPY